MRVSWISKRLWPVFFRLYGEGSVYHDDLEGYTFFMDGNARAKRIGQRLGFAMRNIQQTFVVPLDPSPTAAGRTPEERLVAWLDHAHSVLLERKLTPTMNDVLFLPRDFPFALSATYDLPGFAVSYAFETSNERTLERAKEAFTDLADDLWQRVRRARLPGQERLRPQGDALGHVRRPRGASSSASRKSSIPTGSCTTSSSSAPSADGRNMKGRPPRSAARSPRGPPLGSRKSARARTFPARISKTFANEFSRSNAGMSRVAAKRGHHDHQLIVDVDDLVGPDPHVLEDVHRVGDEPHRALVTSPLALGERRVAGLEHDVGFERHFDVAGPGADVVGLERLVDRRDARPCHIHVLAATSRPLFRA